MRPAPDVLPLRDVLPPDRALAPGQVVTLVVPLARALAVLHAAGMVHGSPTAEAVEVGAGGRPRLVGEGRVASPSWTPDDDVRLLARWAGRHAAGGTPVGDLLVLAATTGGSAAMLASELLARAAPRPLVTGLSTGLLRAGEPLPAQPRRVRAAPRVRRALAPWVRPLLAGGMLAAVLTGGWVTLTGGGGGPASGRGPVPVLGAGAELTVPAPAPPGRPRVRSTAAAVVRWRYVVEVLDSRRAALFAEPGRADAATVDATGSPAYRRDRALLSRLVAGGCRADGLRPRLIAVTLRSRERGRVGLRVVDVLPAYRVLGRRCGGPAPGRARTTWSVWLHSTDAGWRFERVERLLSR